MATPTSTTSASTAVQAPTQYMHLRLVPYLNTVHNGPTASLAPSLRFAVIERRFKEGMVVKVGRHTERSSRQRQQQREQRHNLLHADGGAGNDTSEGDTIYAEDILFRSKVVSRMHAEIWVQDGKFYIRDTASSSGTFLNQMRLSAQNVRSEPFLLRDGDCLQLGVEYRGGEEEIYRCVRMRVEINRRSVTTTALRMATLAALTEAQHGLRRLQPLATKNSSPQPSIPIAPVTTDCCICLLPLRNTPLFLTPCAHAFHYACARNMLVKQRTRNGRVTYDLLEGFLCPMCRSYVDLNAEPADEDDDEDIELSEMTTICMSLGMPIPTEQTNTTTTPSTQTTSTGPSNTTNQSDTGNGSAQKDEPVVETQEAACPEETATVPASNTQAVTSLSNASELCDKTICRASNLTRDDVAPHHELPNATDSSAGSSDAENTHAVAAAISTEHA